jgi:hypothetical protein
MLEYRDKTHCTFGGFNLCCYFMLHLYHHDGELEGKPLIKTEKAAQGANSCVGVGKLLTNHCNKL